MYSNGHIAYCGFAPEIDGPSTNKNTSPWGIVNRFAKDQKRDVFYHNIMNDLRGLKDQKGYEPVNSIKNASLVIIWGDWRDFSAGVSKICLKRGIPKIHMENGMLPQPKNFFIDPCGFLGDSILVKDLSWVDKTDIDNMFKKRKELQQKFQIKSEGYVFVPLQIENDSTVLFHSNFNSMMELLKHVEHIYPNKKIIVKTHPGQIRVDRNPYKENPNEEPLLEKLKRHFTHITFKEGGNMLEMASKADIVVGINSTCIFESAILGVPVLPLGDHPLKMGRKEDFDRILAGALALNISREGSLTPILEKLGVKAL